MTKLRLRQRPRLTLKLSSGGRAESPNAPRNQHRGRRLLQRLVRQGTPPIRLPPPFVYLDLLRGHMLAKELSHQLGDLVAVRFQGEVAGVKQVVLQRLQVALVWLGPGGREDLVVLPPRDQHRRLVRAEVLLPRRVARRIAAVAEEQVELDLVVPLAVEQKLVVSRSIRTNP